ncbi:hypothetical protein [Clostridium sp.]|uniref:hypothetical protein n=1 Tax=Clostridium sp. TaxID=1506 RepID=UPI003463B104
MESKSIKLMLLGITLIMVSLFIQGEPGIRFYGNELYIALIGVIMVLIGFFKKN